MSIIFERSEDELLLILTPERIDIQDILEILRKDEEWHISRTFTVNITHLRFEDDMLNELHFCVGKVLDEYTVIDRDVIGVDHDFYFANSVKLNKRHFVAYRNISVLAKIDHIVEKDVYIGGSDIKDHIPIETFELLIKKFPKTAELNYYANARIATIVKEFFPHTESCEEKFNKFIERQEKSLSSALQDDIQNAFKENAKIELCQFREVRANLLELLNRSDSVREEVWQKQIHGLLRLLYPKYIAGVREVQICMHILQITHSYVLCFKNLQGIQKQNIDRIRYHRMSLLVLKELYSVMNLLIRKFVRYGKIPEIKLCIINLRMLFRNVVMDQLSL